MTIVVGDIHGNWAGLQLALKGVRNANIVIAGDCGIGFNKPSSEAIHLKDVNRWLGQRSLRLFLVRGNHDNPLWWTHELGAKQTLNNIKFCTSGAYKIDKKRFLFIGGAISVDRQIRIPNKNYWFDEGINIPSVNYIDIDYVVSHTAPLDAPPYAFGSLVEGYAKTDKTLLQELRDERAALQAYADRLREVNNIKEWIYGHFHMSDKTPYDIYRALNVMEMYEIK